jgi:hypothetical protein
MRMLMERRGAAAFYELKRDLEEQERGTRAGKARPFDPRGFEPRAFE